VRKFFDVAVRTARTPVGFHTFPSVTPPVKVRQYARYTLRTGSQKARFCESNAPAVMTGSSAIGSHRRPSADLNSTPVAGLRTHPSAAAAIT
jgi:hypothetical protein